MRTLLLLILLLAATLRWMEPGLVSYAYDEAHIVGMAQRVAQLDGYFPILSGGTSAGIQRSAFDSYLFAVPLLIAGGRIEAVIWGTGSLGVLAVALTYLLGMRIAGRHVGLLAALFMAANPWLIFYDRKMWAHIQVLLSVMLLLVAWRIVVKPPRRVLSQFKSERRGTVLFMDTRDRLEKPANRAAFWFPILAACQLLSHTLAILQVTSWLGAFLLAPQRWWRRQMLIGLGVALILLGPYMWAIANQMLRSDQMSFDVGTLLNFPSPWWETLIAPNTWLFVRQLSSGTGISSVVGQMETANLWWRLSMNIVEPLMLVLLLLGSIMVIWYALPGWRNASKENENAGETPDRSTDRAAALINTTSARLLLAWTVGPLFILGLQPTDIYHQYWTVLLPLPALFCSIGLASLTHPISMLNFGRSDVEQTHAAPPLPAFNSAEPSLGQRSMQGVPVQQTSIQRTPVLWAWRAAFAVSLSVAFIWTGSYLSILEVMRINGDTLADWQGIIGNVRASANALGAAEVRVAVNGVDPGYDSEPAVVATLIGNPPFARFVAPSSPPALLLSYDRPSLYLWMHNVPRGEELAEEGSVVETEDLLAQLGQQVELNERGMETSRARIYRLPSWTELDLDFIQLEPAPIFEAGLQLLGYHFSAAPTAANAASTNAKTEQPVEMLLVWRVLDPPAEVRERTVTAFNHILDTSDEMAGQVDGLALLSRDWWPDDLLLQPYRVSLPPGRYRWRVGLYSQTDGERFMTNRGEDSVDLDGLIVE
ncbi:glycosyltransferase family 39 protein [Chloroflexi bacterium TSY]|nr:glycosyltransferase family 39 protein [Chloroflexi bacterium TSY]